MSANASEQRGASASASNATPSLSTLQGQLGDRLLIKVVDMPPEQQALAIQLGLSAKDAHTAEKDVAGQVKRALDEKLGPVWHVIVGKSFGSFITHRTPYDLFDVCALCMH